MRTPWVVRAFLHPDIEFDLTDKNGKPNHAKIIGFYAFNVDVILIALGLTPPLAIFLAMNAVVFGWVGYRTFLGSRTVSAREETLNQNIHTIEERKGWNSEREYQES